MSINLRNNSLQKYSYYSGMTFQMGCIIAIGCFGGYRLDKYLGTTPIFVLICSLASIAIAIYLFVREIITKKK
jgi:F0F1-type ATP synthase assembly protein I